MTDHMMITVKEHGLNICQYMPLQAVPTNLQLVIATVSYFKGKYMSSTLAGNNNLQFLLFDLQKSLIFKLLCGFCNKMHHVRHN